MATIGALGMLGFANGLRRAWASRLAALGTLGFANTRSPSVPQVWGFRRGIRISGDLKKKDSKK